jgi:hypothetical protein
MPEIISCPDCGRKLRVPDELVGKAVKCPDCKVKFTGGITTAPSKGKAPKSASGSAKAPADDQRVVSSLGAKKAPRSKPDVDDNGDDNDRPKRKKRKRRADYDDDDHGSSADERRRGWKMTLLGLNLLTFATYAWLATVAIGLFGCLLVFLIGVGGISSADPTTIQNALMGAGIGVILLYIVLGLGYFTTWALQMTGHGFCMAIPDKVGTGRKILAIVTFCCAAAAILLYLGGCAIGFLAPRAQALSHVGHLPALAYLICYFLFLRGVAKAMREDGLAMQCVYYLIAVLSLPVLAVAMCCIMGLVMGVSIAGAASSNSSNAAVGTMGAMGILAIGCDILFFLVWLGMIAWYIVLLHQIRGAVRNYLD